MMKKLGEHAARYDRAKAAGTCLRCGEPTPVRPDGGHRVYCAACTLFNKEGKGRKTPRPPRHVKGAKAIVLASYPDAVCVAHGCHFHILSARRFSALTLGISGSEQGAWAYAAKKLKPSSHAP